MDNGPGYVKDITCDTPCLDLTFEGMYVSITTIRNWQSVNKERFINMNTVKLNEVLAQTPEQTLADYAMLDALIAKGTYSKKW